MITPTTRETKLNIIVANTNKALAEAVKSASPEQLSLLKEGKDIRSLLTDVLGDKLSGAKSDQTLLEILKNAPAFKNMGNFSDDLQNVVSRLQNMEEFIPKASALETFVRSIQLQDGAALKSQVANSGVFMEGKIASALETLPLLTRTLESLQTYLSKSAFPEARTLEHAIASVLNGADLKQASHDPQSARSLAGALEKIVEAYRTLSTKSDPLYSPRMIEGVQNLQRLAAAETFTALTMNEGKPVLSELYGILLSSKMPEAGKLLDSIESFLAMQTARGSEENRDAFKALTEAFRTVLETKDPALSPQTSVLVSKLQEHLRPSDLLLDNLIKAAVENDLKSQLMQLSDEIAAHPKGEISDLQEPINRLLTQIDYHQFLSHLSASNSVYFPFAWDQLEEGSFSFKKGKEKKFYCEINLKLKEYGKLDLMMAIYDDTQLEIQAHTEQSALKTLLEENIPSLRSVLIDAGLTPRRIRIFDAADPARTSASEYEPKSVGTDLGFEVKA